MPGKAWRPEEHERLQALWRSRPVGEAAHAFAWRVCGEFGVSGDAVRWQVGRLQRLGQMTEAQRVEEPPADGGMSDLQRRLLALLTPRGASYSLDGLCDAVDRGPQAVQAALERLREQGYAVEVSDGGNGGLTRLERDPRPTRATHIHDWYSETVRFGVVADTHLGSVHQRLDFLETLYDFYARESVTDVYHAGDLVDGQGVYRGQEYEITDVGVDAQCDAAIRNYPFREGTRTHFICGNHDLSFHKLLGKRIGPQIAGGRLSQDPADDEPRRRDLRWLGDIEADVLLGGEGGARLRLWHPGGGKAYADSYRPQKLIEGLLGGTKPSLIAFGHWHAMLRGYTRNIHWLLGGTTQGQSSLFQQMGWQPALGGWLVELNISPEGGVNRVKSEFLNFWWERV